MSANKKLVEDHLRAHDRARAAEFLADDVEWIEWADGVPRDGARTQGKRAFVENYGDDELRTDIVRMVEEGNVVVVEGIAHVTKKDGRTFTVRFCNLFEIDGGRIRRKSSFGALLPNPA